MITSDSGKLSVVEFDTTINDWKLVHCEPYGKTGCRRIIPGQYVAADPKGRALLIASVEKQRFVYVMNRDAANRLTISSPLEAHKSECILFAVCGVDVGFDNPIFAMIELDYSEADQDASGKAAEEAEKKLTYYELDLGLNHVVRKWSEPISRTANLLLAVPGGDDGPSGVIVCGENWLSYKHQGHVEVRAAIPRRHDYPADRGLLIVSGTVHRQKDLFFFMVQSEIGDLYKVSLVIDPNDRTIVSDIIISVFDAIQPANSICITRTGLLFAASEFGNHSLFQFQSIGDDETAVKSSRIIDDELNEQLGDDAVSASRAAPLFHASAKLKNLLLIDDISSLSPILDMLVDDVAGEDTPQLLSLCGKGHRSTLRTLRHGVSVSEMAMSDLPGRAQAVWTVKKSSADPHDRLIVVSTSSATIVLSVGETVEEVTDSGFLATSNTLQVVLLDDSALLQVHPRGIRHIRPDKRVNEWKAPGGRSIEKSAVNSRQVIISLSGGELVYFELDMTGQLIEMETLDLGKEVSSLDMGLVPEGRVRSSFLAVGCWDDTVQLLSLEPTDLLSQRAILGLSARAESVCLVHMSAERSDSTASSSGEQAAAPTLYLNVGLSTGVLVRVAVDSVSGSLTDSRQRFLGPKAVKLFRIPFMGKLGVMALTTRPWIMYNNQGRYHQAPVSYEALEFVAPFCSEQCPEGVVAVTGATLRIFTVDNLGEQFNQTVVPLKYSPRKLCRLPNSKQVVVIESDHNEYSDVERAALSKSSDAMVTDKQDGDQDGEEESTIIPLRGPVPSADGKWASCIRVLEPISGTTLDLLELTNNEAAFSVCTCKFKAAGEETFVVVGIAKDLVPLHRKPLGCLLKLYRVLDGRLQLVHQTEIDDIPQCMIEFQGRLVVGSGKTLRMFDYGKKKLLLKCENRQFPTNIIKLLSSGDRIYVGDMAESIHFVKYKRLENVLAIFADDTFPRFTTALCLLDYDTIASADKFGNVYVLRLPEGASDSLEVAAGARQLWDLGVLNGAPIKLECIAHYYLGETVTSLTKRAMILGGSEILIASTIAGGIYSFIPFTVKDDVAFYQHLEMFMRQESPNLCQRDHLAYRSYFVPVKNTIDGDLCERFAALSVAKQKEFAASVDRTPAEIMKKLEDTRNIM